MASIKKPAPEGWVHGMYQQRGVTKAFKEHECRNCGTKIQKGEFYVSVKTQVKNGSMPRSWFYYQPFGLCFLKCGETP